MPMIREGGAVRARRARHAPSPWVVWAGVVLTGALLLAAVPALAGTGGVHGRVLDVTCPGPCQSGLDPRPFEGDAIVPVRRVSDHELVTTLPVEKSRFRTELAAGLYRLRVIPYPDQPKPRCWQGSSRRAQVSAGETRHIRLTVQNACVV
jgi:hypothetical protein